MEPTGATVTEIRRISDDELDKMNLPTHSTVVNPMALVLEDESFLFPGQDVEMNNVGGWRGSVSDIKSLEGESIKSISPMTKEYMQHMGWITNSTPPAVISFSDEKNIYPVQDTEGNGPGVLYQFEEGQVYEISSR